MGSHLRIHFGSRTFEASWPLTVLTAAACAGFISLGHWQWGKGNVREVQAEEFRRGSERPVPLGSRSLAQVERFQRVRVSGHFDTAHQFLLDNRTYDGRAGYEVLTPLDRSDGATILVDRGWVPFSGYRERLPDVSFAPAPLDELVGRVDELPSEGLESGRAPPDAQARWPKVTTYPHAAELSAALGRSAEARILLLDPRAANGFVREWQPPGLPAIRHWSYAVQWWAFAALAGVLWVILGFRRRKDVRSG
jgi:surfeit locus 1 family protein